MEPLLLACCLLTVAAGGKINRERCAAHGFGDTLICGTCDRLRDALSGDSAGQDTEDMKTESERLISECEGCCKHGQVSYIQGRFEVCD